MKKVIIIMMAVLLATLLVVSCKADVKAQEDRLSSVTVDSDASRGFTSTIASNVDPIDSLDWYYTAVKTDGGLFVTGQKTELTAIGTDNSLGQLSFGTWSFNFKLVKHGAGSSAAAVYEGSLTGVSINQEVTNLHVHLNQGDAVGTAKVVFDALSFDVGNLAINNTQGGLFRLEVTEDANSIFVSGSSTYANGVAFDLTSLTSGSLEGAYDVAGAHTYEFIVSYKPASGSLAGTWTEVTRTQYTVYIPLGITMTISGSVEAIESTSAVTATGSIHHYAINNVGAWYCDYSGCGQLLAGTDAAYITVLASDGQPTEIIPLTNGLLRGVGSGTIDVSGNNVTYENSSGVAQTVVIRTTSSDAELTIAAGTDVVKHYDHAGSLTINAIAGNSYHENGSVAFVEIKTGRIVLESNSDVEHIHLTATAGATSSDAYFKDITVAKAASVDMPEFSRDAVEIPDEGRLVVALQDGTEADDEKEYVWLTAVGVYEQVTVSNSATDAGNTYAADLTPEKQVKKDAAQQIANSISFSDGGETYKVAAKTNNGGKTWSYVVVDQSGDVSEAYSATKDANENTVNVQTTGDTPTAVETTKENGLSESTKEDVETGVTLFAGGTGTENDPYLISNASEWNHMYLVMKKAYEEKGANYPTIYFALKNSIDLDGYGINVSDGWDHYNHLSFDGRGFTVNNINTFVWDDAYLDRSDTSVLWPRIERSIIKNATFNYDIVDEGSWGFGMCYIPRDNTQFINVKTTGRIESTTAAWISTFGMYAGFNSTTYYVNCSNEANLVGFFGKDCYITPFGSHCGGDGAKVSFEKCTNYGSISGGDAAGFVGMGNPDHFIFVGDDAAVNYGEINGAKKAGHFQYGSSESSFTAKGTGEDVTKTVSGNGSVIKQITSFTTSAPSNYGDCLTFESIPNASSYKVRITIAVQRYNYDDGANKDKWSGGFPVTVYNQLVDSSVVSSFFRKAYVFESTNSKKDCRTKESCTYSGLYVADGLGPDSDDEKVIEDNGFYLLKHGDSYYYYYLNLGEYEGLLTTAMQDDPNQTLAVSFDIVAYNSNGSVLGTSSCSYGFSITNARNSLTGLGGW